MLQLYWLSLREKSGVRTYQDRNMALDFSIETRQAATVFTEYRNTIDIYTEDCDKDKEFYVKLLKRLLADTDVVVNDIHPLGCRRTVIEACRNDTDNRRKKLYIVDGDIYLLFAEKEIVPNLYILDAYCIENYMICEESICNMAYSLHGRDSYENVKRLLDVSHELENIAEPLINLFFFYSIQMECIKQFSIMNVDCYMNKGDCRIDTGLIDGRISEIRTGLVGRGITEEKIDELLNDRRTKFPYDVETLLTIVSGKNYLIPFFRHYICKCLNCSVNLPKETWKFNLVDRCDLSRLEPLKQAILSA